MRAQLLRRAIFQKTGQLCEMFTSGNSTIALCGLRITHAASGRIAPITRVFDQSHTLLRLVTLERDNSAMLPAVPIFEVDRN
jgi:hypothetical protein